LTYRDPFENSFLLQSKLRLRAIEADMDSMVPQSSNQPPPHVARYVAFSSSLIPVTGTPIRA
jgi:hypothetical protein